MLSVATEQHRPCAAIDMLMRRSVGREMIAAFACMLLALASAQP
eukprot:SAG31_NODE_38675_length_294_cov_1.030769_1_plen_43_part_10